MGQSISFPTCFHCISVETSWVTLEISKLSHTLKKSSLLKNEDLTSLIHRNQPNHTKTSMESETCWVLQKVHCCGFPKLKHDGHVSCLHKTKREIVFFTSLIGIVLGFNYTYTYLKMDVSPPGGSNTLDHVYTSIPGSSEALPHP